MQIDEFLEKIQSKEHIQDIWLRISLTLKENEKLDICKDSDLAFLFASSYKHMARYNRTAKEWFFYNGTNWEQDSGNCFCSELAKDFAKQLWKKMWEKWKDGDPENETERKRMEIERKVVGDLHKLSRRKLLLEDARSVFPFSTEDIDTDIYILNCPNYTLDLRTGECYNHDPEDLLSHVAGADYDPTAECPRFKQFLQEIFCKFDGEKYVNQPDVIDFVQQAFGYALTGSVSEDCMFIAYGEKTRNGKTTLMETIHSVMGSYACTTKPDTLAYTGKPNASGASEDVARLKGKRFVNISEPQKTMHFDVAKIKDMTGGGTQIARRLHENSFEFEPTFKFFVNTNYLPRVTDSTLFTSGRVHVIKFERHFEPEEQDRDLLEILKSEKSGILNWMLEGLEKFKANKHLQPPKEVIEATQEYADDSDKVGQFWNECMRKSENNEKGGTVYSTYCDWCEQSNLYPQSKGLFFDDLRQRGYMQPCSVNGSLDKNGVKGWEIFTEWEEVTSMPTDKDVPMYESV